jgi:hypothetical protein
MSKTPQTEANTTMIHAFRQALFQPQHCNDLLCVCHGQITKIRIGDKGDRIKVHPLVGIVLCDFVEDKIRCLERGGERIGHGGIFDFLLPVAQYFVLDVGREEGKIRSDLKRCNAPWSL